MKDKKAVTDWLFEQFYLPSGPLFIYPDHTTTGPSGNQSKVVQIPGVPFYKNIF